jgi:hypothetical protein
MSRTLFENSKAAMAFAALTIVGAVMMVGTSEGGGVLGLLTTQIEARREAIASEAQRFAEGQSVPDPAAAQSSGRANQPAVFGDYDPAAQAAAAQAGSKGALAQAPTAKPPAGQENNPMYAPLSPGAQIPGAGDSGEPVITEREMTIQPQ